MKSLSCICCIVFAIAIAVSSGTDRLSGLDVPLAVQSQEPIKMFDSEGRLRMVIGQLEPDVYGIQIIGPGTGPRIEVKLGSDGEAAVSLCDRDGRSVAGMLVPDDDRGAIYLRDPERRLGRAGLEFRDGEGMWMGLWDHESKRLISLER